MSRLRALLACLFVLITATGASIAQEMDLKPAIAALAKGSLSDREAKVQALLETGDDRIIPVLTYLADGDLYVRKSDGAVFIAEREGRVYTITDPLTGEVTRDVPRRDMDKIKINNSLRRTIRDGLSLFALGSKDPAKRLEAAEVVFNSQDPAALPLIESRLEKEDVAEIVELLDQARSAIILTSEDMPENAKLEAISILRERGGHTALALLSNIPAEAGATVNDAAARAITSIERRLALWNGVQNIWYGLSLGSVLLLASIGLAITFGVMGVINMAHGEMVMLGAYSTFAVQQAILILAPGLFDYSLLFALPVAFLVAGSVGLVLERGIIRFLYGRPLETLLATWGVSLILQQTVRTIFGPSNKEVVNPSWMSGAVDLAGLSLTWNRNLDLLLRPCGLCAFIPPSQAHPDGPADARRDPEPQDGVLHGHPHPMGRCLHLRAGLRHCRHRRRCPHPRSATSPPISDRATSSTASWSSSSAAWAISGAH